MEVGSDGWSQVVIITPITAHLGKVFLWEGTEGRDMTRPGCGTGWELRAFIKMETIMTNLEVMVAVVTITRLSPISCLLRISSQIKARTGHGHTKQSTVRRCFFVVKSLMSFYRKKCHFDFNKQSLMWADYRGD